ncbi:MAG: hypothetical protein ISS33_06025 [Candidatus Omnitrophica bacterium]|nr:hypothetical protein [Candidatus Omnitrophota bacterium]
MSKVSSDQIVVSKYDHEAEEYREVAYILAPKVELKSIDSLKDIAVGNYVEIVYVVKGGKKIATAITVEESFYEEGYTPSETYEEEPEYSPEGTEY